MIKNLLAMVASIFVVTLAIAAIIATPIILTIIGVILAVYVVYKIVQYELED